MAFSVNTPTAGQCRWTLARTSGTPGRRYKVMVTALFEQLLEPRRTTFFIQYLCLDAKRSARGRRDTSIALRGLLDRGPLSMFRWHLKGAFTWCTSDRRPFLSQLCMLKKIGVADIPAVALFIEI